MQDTWHSMSIEHVERIYHNSSPSMYQFSSSSSGRSVYKYCDERKKILPLSTYLAHLRRVWKQLHRSNGQKAEHILKCISICVQGELCSFSHSIYCVQQSSNRFLMKISKKEANSWRVKIVGSKIQKLAFQKYSVAKTTKININFNM